LLSDRRVDRPPGVEPDLLVPRAGLHAAGADLIFDEGVRAVFRMLEGVPRRRRL
jgi:hypothetical protein